MKYLFQLIIAFSPSLCIAQLEGLFVETYYVCDDQDATNTIGGEVEPGLKTYRIYIDLMPGTKLLALYGDTDHPFIIQSTTPFYNHIDDGQSVAKEFIKARYGENLVALDTWLTIGQTTKKQGEITHYGLPKHQDTNGTFIGGENNDGGSELVESGLLNNQDLAIPLTTSDGMDTLDFTPENWFTFGLTDFLSGVDSTIFGSANLETTSFNSTNFTLSNSGVLGVNADSNYVLIAQLSTMGELEMRLNFTIEYLNNGEPTVLSYVGTNVINSESEIYSPLLSYPLECGCTDPNFLEFDVTYACPDETQCQTPIVYGCLDTLACNYDSSSNFSIPSLCCYPGWCADRDIASVCPELMGPRAELKVFPNPSSQDIAINILSGIATNATIIMRNSQGHIVMQESLPQVANNLNTSFHVENFDPGIYQIQAITALGNLHQLVVVL